MKRKLFLILTMLCMGTVYAPAQLYRYLGTENGLSSRRVISIRKDLRGYMWFLTHEGIDRYNGKQYVHYPLIAEGKPTQQFPNLNDLYIDNSGDIWITGKNGYAFKYNSFQDQYDLVLNFSDSIKSNKRLPLTHTCLDSNNQLWMCTKTGQYIYHTQKKIFYQIESPIQEEITYLTQGKDNQYFISTNHNIYIARLENRVLSVKTDSLLENFHIIQHLYYHEPTESLFIGTMMDGFFVYDLRARTLTNIGDLKDVSVNHVVQAYRSDREILIATDGNGVYKLDLSTLKLQHYLTSNLHYSNKMNGDIIKDIYIDEEGRIWMAVFPISITVFSDHYPGIEWFRSTQDTSHSLTSNQITYLLEDSDGDIWMATSDGVSFYSPRTKTWKSMLSNRLRPEKGEQNSVFISLCESTPGTILVGGYMSGMYRINKKDMIPQYFSPQTEGYSNIRPDKYIRSIYRDEEGTVWAGGYYNFKSIRPATGEMEHYTTDYPITFITSKSKNELWIGTINGLYLFDKKKKEMHEMFPSANMGTVNTIYHNGNQTCIGTHGSGIWIYQSQTDNLTNYNTANSALICNNIYSILPGNNKHELILSTENELVCFNTQERIFQNWTKEQGLPSAKFNTAAGIKTHKGVLAFGSDDGIIIIKDSINLPHKFQSKLVFSDFHIHYQKMKPGSKHSPLTKPIDETEEIILSSDQNIFSFNVSSINYDCPSRILYSWKLEGFYDEWSIPSQSNLIRYTNISPGKYLLKVRTILMDDGHTLEERKIRIIIEPPFTQTVWAYLIYITIILLLTAGILRLIWLRKNKKISNEKIHFFIHTAHDIRTPLTLIKAPLNEISNQEKLSEEGKKNLDMAIQSTNKLAELANKLIEFQKEELYSPSINVNKCELNAYLQDFIKQFQPYAAKKNINFTYKGTNENLTAWIDRNKIDSILHNLVSNALKYTPDNGSVSICLQNNATHWLLNISDTGIGISANDQKRLFKHLFRGNNAINLQITGSGIGLVHTYKLIKRHQGEITVTSKENEGTTFSLRFPIDSKKYIHHSEPSIQPTANNFIYDEQGMETSEYSPISANAATILLVEDNKDLRNFLRQSLSKTYHIMEAGNGQEALEQIAVRQPDLILSDVMMPVMRGDDLCRKIKNDVETSHIPVVLLTALNDKENIIHGLEIKADNYIVKPFDVDILKASIASILTNKEIIRKRFAQLNYQTEDLAPEVPGLELDREFISKVTETIRKNLGNDFNVDSLCAAFHMSRSSFYNKIKALTNQSPSDFVRQIRMHEACALLRSRKYTVAEVSDQLGYSDPKYFTDIFKKHYGMTPSAYMKQEKK